MSNLLNSQPDNPATLMFHAGTEIDGNVINSTGGRIAGVVGSGINIDEARKEAYAFLDSHSVERTFFRRDIGSLP